MERKRYESFGIRDRIRGEWIAERQRMLDRRAPHPADVYGLTRQERVVSSMIADGADTDDICKQLCITRNTLKFHVRNIGRKMNGVTD